MDAFPPNTSSAAGYQASTDQPYGEIYGLWESLQQKLRDNDQLRCAHALLKANDNLFQSFACIRTDPDDQFREALHLSIVQFAPPDDVFEIILALRHHFDWLSVRHLMIPQLEKLGARIHSSNSLASQNPYSRSSGHHSSASARSYPNTNSSYSLPEAIPEARGEDDDSYPTRFHASRGPSMSTESGKQPRMAPGGQKFTCPYPQCRGKAAFVRLGHWDNHHLKYHPGGPILDPYLHLQQNLHVDTKGPGRMESTATSAAVPSESPRSTLAEVNTMNDFPASGHEYHLPLRQLPSVHHSMMDRPDYFGGTGVAFMHDRSYFLDD